MPPVNTNVDFNATNSVDADVDIVDTGDNPGSTLQQPNTNIECIEAHSDTFIIADPETVQSNPVTDQIIHQPAANNVSQTPSFSDTRADENSAGQPHAAVSSPDASQPPSSGHGQRVHVSGASFDSFLQTVQQLVSAELGPSQFSHNDQRDSSLEIVPPQTSHPTPSGTQMTVKELELSQRRDYLHRYYTVTEAFLDIFERGDLEDLIASYGDKPRHRVTAIDQIAFELVMAIGAQCESSSTATQVSQPIFLEARRCLFTGLGPDPDLYMIRVYLLMAFYMLGEGQRNTAYKYIGVAVRVCVFLGLHRPTVCDETFHPSLSQIWASTCIMDRFINFLLGQPAWISGQLPQGEDEALLQKLTKLGHFRSNLLIETYKIANIIHGIKNTIHDQKEISVPMVKQYLNYIDQWKENLNKSTWAQSFPGGAQASDKFPEQAGVLSSLHVSCVYYFAITLATRPILVATLTNQLNCDAAHSQLSEACIQAAVLLSQACEDARKCGVLEGNMCMLEALVFVAGLTIGLYIFANDSVPQDIEVAFHDTQNVLRFFAAQSSQVAHDLGTLNSLSNAIATRTSKEKARASRFDSKIHDLQSGSSEQGQQQEQQLPPEQEQQEMEVPQFPEFAPDADDPQGWQPTAPENSRSNQVGHVTHDWSYDQVQNEEILSDREDLDIMNWDDFAQVI